MKFFKPTCTKLMNRMKEANLESKIKIKDKEEFNY